MLITVQNFLRDGSRFGASSYGTTLRIISEFGPENWDKIRKCALVYI